MSATSEFGTADKALLQAIVLGERGLSRRIGPSELTSARPIVARLRDLSNRATHPALVARAVNLAAILDEGCSTAFQGPSLLTTADAAFAVSLAACAREGRSVSHDGLAVWAASQRRALPSDAWDLAATELCDLAALRAGAIVPVALRGPLTVKYKPITGSREPLEIVRTDLPAVRVSPIPEALRQAVDEATASTERYARTLKAFDSPSVEMRLARLPHELFEIWAARPQNAVVRHRIDSLGATSRLAVGDLVERLLPDVTDVDDRHVVVLSELLQRFGVGFEPDPRFLAPMPGLDTELSLFPWESADHQPRPAFVSCVAVLQIGTAMALCDGHLDPREARQLGEELDRSPGLSESERNRLRLRLDHLMTGRHDVGGVVSRLRNIRGESRNLVADVLVRVAAVDGVVQQAEYEMLSQAYRVMRFDRRELDDALASLAPGVVFDHPVVEPVVRARRLPQTLSIRETGGKRDRRSEVGREQDEKRYDALRDLLLGSEADALQV